MLVQDALKKASLGHIRQLDSAIDFINGGALRTFMSSPLQLSK